MGTDSNDLEAEALDGRGPRRGPGATAWVSVQAAPILPPSAPGNGHSCKHVQQVCVVASARLRHSLIADMLPSVHTSLLQRA